MSSAMQEPQSVALAVSELSEEEQKRYARFKALRESQEREANRRLQISDLIAAGVALLGMRHLVVRYNIPAFKIFWRFCLISLALALYRGRAPKKTLSRNKGDFAVFPVLGQVLQVKSAIEKGLVGIQLERFRMRDFKTSELVLFGPIQDFGLMDTRDREYILRVNWRNFTKNSPGAVGFQEVLAPVMGRGIFTVDPRTEKGGDDEWAEHRKVASHLFAANALRFKMESAFANHAHRLVRLLKEQQQADKIIDLQECIQAFTFETICEIAFGVDPGAIQAAVVEGKKIDFLVRFDRAQNLCLNRLIIPTAVWKTLRFFNLSYEAQLSEDSRELKNYVQAIIAERKREFDSLKDFSDDRHGDLLSLYMKTARDQHKPYLGEELYLQDVVLNIMVAGRDTTSSTLIQLFRVLSSRPDVVDKILEEMTRVLKGADRVSWDDIKELPYCSAVFNETLRLYPPVPGDFRLCNETCELPSGIVIPKGARVSLPIAAIGRDRSLWDSPEEFIPERWIETANDKRITKRIPEYVLPCFWGGPRICLGKDAARLEVLSTLYIILSSGMRFDLIPGQSEKIKIGPVQFYEDGVKVKVRQV